MPTRDEPWPDGTPCWVDLSSPDVPATQRFYAAVLGWEWGEQAGEEYGGYCMSFAGGRVAAGLGPAQDPSGPNGWTMYVATPDADATAARVGEAGGSVVMGPFDVGPMGRMAVALDPQGGSFGLWQAGQHGGLAVYNEPGALVWEEVGLTDPAAGQEFYRAVFGWEFAEMDGMPGYATFSRGGDPLGGAGTPELVGTAGWQVCFAVQDADAAVAAATEGGGAVLMGPQDTSFGRYAALADPFGARFTVMGVPG